MSFKKSLPEILEKLGIKGLNEMQSEAQVAIDSNADIIIQSPTGTGKTLAFLLPMIRSIETNTAVLQALVVVPTRELAIQIEQVVREMGSGLKINSVYGGQSFNQDRLNLKHPPELIVGTPGRLVDHMRRGTIDTHQIEYLVLDEFDKSLEIGFEDEMKQIINQLDRVQKRILTSATMGISIPDFMHLSNPVLVNSDDIGEAKMVFKKLVSPTKDKIQTLSDGLEKLVNKRGIVFCNFKDSIQRISDYLFEMDVSHGCFYGVLDQHARELSLLKFRNGTHNIILATDLAARGLDLPDLDYIIHYHLPLKEHEFVHRNGRTARMHSHGTVYILQSTNEELPDYLPKLDAVQLQSSGEKKQYWKTLKFSAGRRDKVSKGDIAGLCYKKGGLQRDELGPIELMSDASYVAVKAEKVLELIHVLNGARLKKNKLRVSGC